MREINGHSFEEIDEAVRECLTRSGRPSVIVADTIKGKGVSFMEDNPDWHAGPTNPKQTEAALHEILDRQ